MSDIIPFSDSLIPLFGRKVVFSGFLTIFAGAILGLASVITFMAVLHQENLGVLTSGIFSVFQALAPSS